MALSETEERTGEVGPSILHSGDKIEVDFEIPPSSLNPAAAWDSEILLFFGWFNRNISQTIVSVRLTYHPMSDRRRMSNIVVTSNPVAFTVMTPTKKIRPGDKSGT
jgi:hypothetical protein